MTGSVELLRDRMKTEICTLSGTIAEKHAWLRFWNKLVVRVRSKPRIAKIIKGSMSVIVRSLIKEFL